MKLFGSDTNSGMIQRISDWYGMNFNYNQLPCRQFRIEIRSETIRNFPNHSGICIRTKQFYSDLSEVSFQSESVRDPFQINPNW